MNDRRKLERIAAERPRPAPDNPVQMAKVTATDPDAGTFTVDLGGGTEATLTQVGGYLPQVDAMVPLLRNGGDLVSLLQQQMVDGDLRSRTFSTGVSGWIITADGDAEFNSVLVRGDVEVDRLVTRGGVGSVTIDVADYGSTTIAFDITNGDPSADVGTIYVGGDLGNGYMALDSPDGLGGGDQARLYLVTSSPGVLASFLQVDADHLQMNGASLNAPPYVAVHRNSTQSPTNGSWQALTHNVVQRQTTDIYGGNAIAIEGSPPQFRPTAAGWYEAKMSGVWDPNNPGVVTGVALSKNGSTTAGPNFIPGNIGIANQAFTAGGQTAVGDFRCNGTTDYIQPMCIPYAAGQSFKLTQFSLRRVSD